MQAAWYVVDILSGDILACSECAEKIDADEAEIRAEEREGDAENDRAVDRILEDRI